MSFYPDVSADDLFESANIGPVENEGAESEYDERAEAKNLFMVNRMVGCVLFQPSFFLNFREHDISFPGLLWFSF